MGDVRHDPSRPPSMKNRIKTWGWFIIRIAMGGLFTYAGVLKIAAPLEFADHIASYRILSEQWINLAALSLPWLELFAGISLITGFKKRLGSLAVAGMTLLFAAALLSAMTRGIHIDCGCFGSHAPGPYSTLIAMARDLLLLGLAIRLYQRDAANGINPKRFL